MALPPSPKYPLMGDPLMPASSYLEQLMEETDVHQNRPEATFIPRKRSRHYSPITTTSSTTKIRQQVIDTSTPETLERDFYAWLKVN